MARPGTTPIWATGGSIVVPGGGKQILGWVAGEKPPASYQNWWQNLVYQWIVQLTSESDTGIAGLAAINASFSAHTARQARQDESAAVFSLRSIYTASSMQLNDIAADITTLGASAIIVAVGGSGAIISSGFGADFSVATPGSSFASTFNGVCFGSNGFAACGASGEVQTSPDGGTWTRRHTGGATLNAVASSGANYVAVGDTGLILQSSSVGTWTSRTSATGTDSILTVAWVNGIFMATTATGKIQTSVDGITWILRLTLTGSGTPVFHISQPVCWNAQLGWFAVYNTDGASKIGVAYSSNAIGWTQVASSSVSGIANPGNVIPLALEQQAVYFDFTGTLLQRGSASLTMDVHVAPNSIGATRSLPLFIDKKFLAAHAINKQILAVAYDGAANSHVYQSAPYAAQF